MKRGMIGLWSLLLIFLVLNIGCGIQSYSHDFTIPGNNPDMAHNKNPGISGSSHAEGINWFTMPETSQDLADAYVTANFFNQANGNQQGFDYTKGKIINEKSYQTHSLIIERQKDRKVIASFVLRPKTTIETNLPPGKYYAIWTTGSKRLIPIEVRPDKISSVDGERIGWFVIKTRNGF